MQRALSADDNIRAKAARATTKGKKIKEPRTLKEAQAQPEWEKWKKALEAECKNMIDNGVFTIVDQEKEKENVGNIIKPKLVFKVKHNGNGEVEKYKVRLVAKGFTQKEGIDYKETFAPVAHHASKLLTYSMIASKGLTAIEFDIKAAFLTATVPNKCYLCLAPPPGMNMGKGKLSRIRKALHGLVQSPRLFNKEVTSHFKSIGFEQSTHDECMFCYKKGNDYAVISLHVDDGVAGFSSEELKKKIMKKMRDRCELATERKPTKNMGCEVDYDMSKGKLTVKMENCMRNMAKQFDLSDAKFVDDDSSLVSDIANLADLY